MAMRSMDLWGLTLIDKEEIEPGTRLFSVKISDDDDHSHHLRDIEEVQAIVSGTIAPKSKHGAAFREFVVNGGDAFHASCARSGYDVEVTLERVA